MIRPALRWMMGACLLMCSQVLSANWLPDANNPKQEFEWLKQQIDSASSPQEKQLAFQLAADVWQKHPEACGNNADEFFDDYLNFLLQGKDASITSRAEVEEALDIWHQRRELQLGEALGRECLPKTLPFSKRIQRLGEEMAVLHVILLPDQIELILVKGQRRIRQRVRVSARRVEALAKRFVSAVQSSQSRAQHYAKLFSRWMIQPVAAELADPALKVLQLQLDHRLLALPWALVPTGNTASSERLGTAFPLVIGSGPESVASTGNAERVKVLFGALSDADLNEKYGFSALPGVLQEWEQIRPGLAGKALLDQNFTSERVGRALDDTDFSVLHLATHGELGQAPNSYVLMGDGPLRLEHLGGLVRSRRFSLQPLRLVTLSACDSAVNFPDQQNARRARLGLAGVTLQAGAQNALASLWPVADRATSQFMGAFYRALTTSQAPVTVAEALQQARRELQTQGMSERDWAAFQLYGNGR